MMKTRGSRQNRQCGLSRDIRIRRRPVREVRLWAADRWPLHGAAAAPGMTGPLSAAFGLGPRDVITIVGGGGKTTTLYRLGRELRGRSGVVITTTTHIMIPPPEPDLETVVEAEAESAPAACRGALARGHLPVLGTRFTPEGRLGGVAPEVVDLCAAEADLAYVVVEADGSAHKPFKAPLAHEPVVPHSTTLLL